MNPSRVSTFSSRSAIVSFSILIVLTVWWVTLNPLNPTDATEHARSLWGGLYQIMAYWGGINGLLIARKWGGSSSLIGKSIIAFSIGLLCQGFGQTVYTYYLFHWGIQAPYPSLGDLGYFGTIPFYIYGAAQLTKVCGVKFSLKSYLHRMQAFVVPVLMIVVSYILFLKEYTFDVHTPLETFLNFGYPLGQAVYVSIAILALAISGKFLGGVMRKPIVFLLVALIFQYLSDYIFLYQFNAGQWYVGGLNDFMYLVSYFLMGISLIQLSSVFEKIKNS